MKKTVARETIRLAGKAREFIGRKSGRELDRFWGRSAPKPGRSRNGSLLRAAPGWQEWEISLLGKHSDREVSRMTQRTLAAVQTKRNDLKLPSAISVQRDWTKQEDALLVRYSDREVARRLQRSYSSVQHRRQRLGIPKPNLLALPWSKQEDSLLGRLPDVVLSQHLSRTLAAVRFRRCDKRIPPCVCPSDLLSSAIAKFRLVLRRVQAEKQKAAIIAGEPVSRFRRRGEDSRPRKLRWWTATEDKLLGKFPDAELARRLGRSELSVTRRRLRMGILFPVQVKLWTTEDDALVGAMPDRELALKLNRTLIAVKARRQHKRLPPFRHSQSKSPAKLF